MYSSLITLINSTRDRIFTGVIKNICHLVDVMLFAAYYYSRKIVRFAYNYVVIKQGLNCIHMFTVQVDVGFIEVGSAVQASKVSQSGFEGHKCIRERRLVFQQLDK